MVNKTKRISIRLYADDYIFLKKNNINITKMIEETIHNLRKEILINKGKSYG